MSVRNGGTRVRPRGPGSAVDSAPGSARARVTPRALAATAPPLAGAVVVAAGALYLLADVRRTGVLLTVTALLCAVAAGLAVWGVRRAVGWALGPVERLDADLDRLRGADLARRVAVPASGDEVERLAGRVNCLLGRLENEALERRAFIADASHEIRTPLAGLRTRIELALAVPDDAELVDTLRGALGDVDRLHQIVDDLLVLARLDSGERAPRDRLDLGALVEDETRRRAPRVPLSVKAEPGVLVDANRARLRRVLQNLLANAERHAATRIEVEVRAEPGEAVAEVRDDGPGIPPADRDRVFERFARLDAARSRADGGSGLGLAIARQVAVAHGGRLYAGDAARGARLVLRLPLAPPDPGEDAAG
ncbi:HAMP domain-containing histidine kinase [Actinomadura decatromicini]|uniref:histidine kinase n=1 Tax=Actinomadura decatromicini TaxID=2604572 RepID=A0A5D3FJ49_9ACTN|nr:HAMP domain-containing histidine kinase [Actinomadura decatromicini]